MAPNANNKDEPAQKEQGGMTGEAWESQVQGPQGPPTRQTSPRHGPTGSQTPGDRPNGHLPKALEDLRLRADQ